MNVENLYYSDSSSGSESSSNTNSPCSPMHATFSDYVDACCSINDYPLMLDPITMAYPSPMSQSYVASSTEPPVQETIKQTTTQQLGLSFKAKPRPKKVYECPTCAKTFNRPSALQTHSYTHTSEKPFQCGSPNCGRSFSVVSNLRRHYKIHQRASVSNKLTPEDRMRCVIALMKRSDALLASTNPQQKNAYCHIAPYYTPLRLPEEQLSPASTEVNKRYSAILPALPSLKTLFNTSFSADGNESVERSFSRSRTNLVGPSSSHRINNSAIDDTISSTSISPSPSFC